MKYCTIAFSIAILCFSTKTLSCSFSNEPFEDYLYNLITSSDTPGGVSVDLSKLSITGTKTIITAQLIGRLLENSYIKKYGLTLVNGKMNDHLNISDFEIDHPVIFENFDFNRGVNLSLSNTQLLVFRNCDFYPAYLDDLPIGSFMADGLVSEQDLLFYECNFYDTVRLVGAEVNGNVEFSKECVFSAAKYKPSESIHDSIDLDIVKDPRAVIKDGYTNNGAIDCSYLETKNLFVRNAIVKYGHANFHSVNASVAISLQSLSTGGEVAVDIILDNSKCDVLELSDFMCSGLLSLQSVTRSNYTDRSLGHNNSGLRSLPQIGAGKLDLFDFTYDTVNVDDENAQVRLNWMRKQIAKRTSYSQPYSQYADYLEKIGLANEADQVRYQSALLLNDIDGWSLPERIYDIVFCLGYCAAKRTIIYFASLIALGALVALVFRS